MLVNNDDASGKLSPSARRRAMSTTGQVYKHDPGGRGTAGGFTRLCRLNAPGFIRGDERRRRGVPRHHWRYNENLYSRQWEPTPCRQAARWA